MHASSAWPGVQVRDRQLVAQRMQQHVSSAESTPLLIFPEVCYAVLCSALLRSAQHCIHKLDCNLWKMIGAGYLCQQRVLCYVQTRSF